MNENLQFVFKTIAAVVTNGQLPGVPQNINWNLVYDICSKHNIANIIAYAISSNKDLAVPEDIKKAFIKQLQLDVMLNEMQKTEMELISQKFEELNLEYMPVKGIFLKNLYPSSDMRRMSDIDILTKIGQEEKYKNAMLELGYTFVKDKGNEYVFKKSVVSIELHRYLITPGNDDLFSYYETGWNIAKKDSEKNFRFVLSPEDEFVYLITHFVKHYRNAGCGIKPLIDIWLYRKKCKLDMDYVDKQLNQMNLYKFTYNLFNLLEVWFEDRAADELTKEMTRFIVMSGEYGTTQNSSAAESIRGKYKEKNSVLLKLKLYFKILFLNKKAMKQKYPVLDKVPVLLPFLWIYRIVNVILFKKDRIAQNSKGVENKFGENVDKYAKHMEDVGLDIYNGRENK